MGHWGESNSDKLKKLLVFYFDKRGKQNHPIEALFLDFVAKQRFSP